MAYAVYTDHPESRARYDADFTAWSLWAEHYAPWSGVGADSQTRTWARLSSVEDVADVLDRGGVLTLEQARRVLDGAGDVMSDKVQHVYRFATQHGYGVRVHFHRGFDPPSASQMHARGMFP